MRYLLCVGLFLCAASASAQNPYDSDPEYAYLDSLRTQADLAGLSVLSVIEHNGGYAYDLDGRDESSLVLWSEPLPGSGLVLRAPDAGHVMVLVEPYFGVPGALPNAILLTPERSAAEFQPDIGFQPVTAHRIQVYVCGQASSSGSCLRWEMVPPLSGGDGLKVTIIQGPERGGVYVPAPYMEPDPPLEPDPR